MVLQHEGVFFAAYHFTVLNLKMLQCSCNTRNNYIQSFNFRQKITFPVVATIKSQFWLSSIFFCAKNQFCSCTETCFCCRMFVWFELQLKPNGVYWHLQIAHCFDKLHHHQVSFYYYSLLISLSYQSTVHGTWLFSHFEHVQHLYTLVYTFSSQ